MSNLLELFEQTKAEAEDTGNTGDTTPSTVPPADSETSTNEHSTETFSPNSDTEQAPQHSESSTTREETTEVERPFNWDELTNAHPELLPLAKQLQADYTRKRQQEADQLKKYEGVDEQSIALVREINQKLVTNPVEALQILDNVRQSIQSRVPSTAVNPKVETPDPLATFVPQTDEGYYLMEVIKNLRSELSSVVPVVNQIHTQSQQAQYNARIENEFTSLESKLNSKIPTEQRQQIHNFAAQNQLPNMEMAYKVMNYEKAQREAAARASQEVQRKASSPPVPGGVNVRSSGESEPSPKSFKEGFIAEAAKAGLTF